MKKDLDEVHHVFTSHILEFCGLTEDEYDDWSKKELFDKILLTQKQFDDFEENWLNPVLDELEHYRIKELEKNER